MQFVAEDQLKSAGETTEIADDFRGEVGNVAAPVEIEALAADKSDLAAQILQHRMLRNNLAKNAARKLQCSDGNMSNIDKLPLRGAEGGRIMRMATSLMPIISVLPKASWADIRADVISGLTVGVMVIPQSMSYGSIAGLEYIYGMYSACIPTLVYAFFGQSRQLAVGPVAMVSLLVEAGLRGALTEDQCPDWDESSGLQQYDVCPTEYAKLAFLTSALVGFFQILASVCKLGFLVSFLGHPVISGFTSGAAIIIGLSQLKYFLGFDIEKSQYVYVTIGKVFEGLGDTKFVPLILGVTWLFYLVANRMLARKYKRFSMMGPMGPLLSCVLGTLLVICVPVLRDEFSVKYVGEIPSGMIPFSMNTWDFGAIGRVLPTAAVATLIGFMESIAIGKNLAQKNGYEIEAGTELFALGLSNLVGACFSCYPVTGSFSRSAVNNQTGAKTQLSGLITAAVMFLTLMALTPLFYYLPKFALAAIVMSSVIPLVAYQEAMKLWKVKKSDFVLWTAAFLGTLFLGVLMGILLAVALSLVIVIFESVRPQIAILWRIPGTTIYRSMKQESSGAFIPNVFIARIGSSMYFANAAYIKDMLLSYMDDIEEINPTKYVVLEMTAVISVDSTAVHVLHDVVHDFRSRGIQVAFAMVGNRVDRTMRKAGLKSYIGESWFLPTVNEAVQHCMRHRAAKNHVEAGAAKKEQDIHVPQTAVTQSTEIGYSNQIHGSATAVFITLAKDVPMILSEITGALKKNKVNVLRALVEPLEQGGARHSYFVQSVSEKAKLKDSEIQRLREDLVKVVGRAEAAAGQTEASSRVEVNKDSRVRELEETLAQERQVRLRFEEELTAQGRRMDILLAEKANMAASRSTNGDAESRSDTASASEKQAKEVDV